MTKRIPAKGAVAPRKLKLSKETLKDLDSSEGGDIRGGRRDETTRVQQSVCGQPCVTDVCVRH